MEKKVMIFGTFDGIHEGHRSLFRQAHTYGERLIAIVAQDATVAAVKGRPPRQGEQERLYALRKETHIDEAVLGDADDKHAVIRKYRPDVICLGYDQKNFIDTLEKTLRDTGLHNTKIIRLRPFKPETYKSSLIQKND